MTKQQLVLSTDVKPAVNKGHHDKNVISPPGHKNITLVSKHSMLVLQAHGKVGQSMRMHVLISTGSKAMSHDPSINHLHLAEVTVS